MAALNVRPAAASGEDLAQRLKDFSIAGARPLAGLFDEYGLDHMHAAAAMTSVLQVTFEEDGNRPTETIVEYALEGILTLIALGTFCAEQRMIEQMNR